jgi:hypothetical protein
LRFNWNKAIGVAAMMADDPTIKGPIVGKGYQVKRNPSKGKKQQLVLIVTEGDYSEESESENAS